MKSSQGQREEEDSRSCGVEMATKMLKALLATRGSGI